jgi:hypothetical protein
MRSRLLLAALLLVALQPNIAPATVVLVPEIRTTIQGGVDLASNGDTVSVWGPPPGQPSVPPWTYYENVSFAGKSIFVVNRSFLPGQVPYDSSWNHVIINGGGNGATVTVVQPIGAPEATLKGFTITGGYTGGAGGGISCVWGRMAIIKNRVTGNVSMALPIAGGGGISYVSSWQGGVRIIGNLIEENSAPVGNGGGIFVWDLTAEYVQISDNVVRFNEAYAGGGMGLASYVVDPPPPTKYVSNNTVENNTLTPPDGRGGGFYCLNWCYRFRNNVVRYNELSGVYAGIDGGGVAAGPNMGTTNDPGFNVLMQNGDYDLVAMVAPQPVEAVGNYWGTLNTATMLSRISSPGRIYLDPVAASGKWFSVNANSLCETGVLVTGDLVVDPGCTLSVAPGKTFEFSAPPDHSASGGDPALTDLIVGSDPTSYGTLEATGTADLPISFRL